MLTFIEAIARQEGFNIPGSLPNRHNNPGDIEDGPFAQSHGALPPNGHRFATFPDADTGFGAMRALLTEHYLGLTVAAALCKWAPPIENNVSAYQANVCLWTGLTPETVLTKELIG
jgi:hypothetical protein